MFFVAFKRVRVGIYFKIGVYIQRFIVSFNFFPYFINKLKHIKNIRGVIFQAAIHLTVCQFTQQGYIFLSWGFPKFKTAVGNINKLFLEGFMFCCNLFLKFFF